MPLLSAATSGAHLELSFRGTAVGAYVLAGPDAGIVEASIDGGEPRPVDLYHRFSKGLHYPRTILFAEDLQAGEHRLDLRISESTSGRGHAVRILQFTVNGRPVSAEESRTSSSDGKPKRSGN